MTDKEIISNNKLIAEFMGWKVEKNDPIYPDTFYGTSPEGRRYNGVASRDYEECWKRVQEKLKYHKEWNWLVPVLNKLEEYAIYTIEYDDADGCTKPYLVQITSNGWKSSNIFIAIHSDSLEDAMYKAIVKFIKELKTVLSILP